MAKKNTTTAAAKTSTKKAAAKPKTDEQIRKYEEAKAERKLRKARVRSLETKKAHLIAEVAKLAMLESVDAEALAARGQEVRKEVHAIDAEIEKLTARRSGGSGAWVANGNRLDYTAKLADGTTITSCIIDGELSVEIGNADVGSVLTVNAEGSDMAMLQRVGTAIGRAYLPRYMAVKLNK